MRPQRDIIRSGLQELSSATKSGGNCWVTFEANGNEHWLQCTGDQMNMDWPFSSPPGEHESLNAWFGLGKPLKIEGWDVDSYVTFDLGDCDIESLITGIDLTFQELYDLGPEYRLSYRIEEA